MPPIAIYELAVGVKRSPAGKRRQFLEEWFADLLGSECEVLAFDRDAALASAEIEAEARRHRRVVKHRDLLMLGTAKARSVGIATRNVTQSSRAGRTHLRSIPGHTPSVSSRRHSGYGH